MRDLRIKERMSKEDQKEFSQYRTEYVYGSVSTFDNKKPIILKSSDFWMPLTRAKRIHAWLGKAIKECENRKKKRAKRKVS